MDREIFSNIQTFVQLVQITTTEAVSEWGDTALRKALRWGEYVEKLHTKVHHRHEIVCKLSRCLERIQHQPGGVPGEELAFQDLKYARKIIIKNLLNNCSLSSELYQLMLTSISSQAPGSILAGVLQLEEFLQFAESGASLKTTVKVMSGIDANLTKRVTETSDPSTDILIDAQLLRTHLLCQMTDKRGGSERTTESLKTLLHSVAAKSGGLEVIGTMLGLGKPEQSSYTGACLQECEEFVFQWLMGHKEDYKNR